jgi:plasmid stabilization system protein ParE
MRVRFSDKAKRDLAEIGAFIRRQSPYWAARFTRELAFACRAIGDMPHAFPLLPEREATGIRKRAYKGYLIFYEVEPDGVSILHIFNGARDFERILFPDE